MIRTIYDVQLEAPPSHKPHKMSKLPDGVLLCSLLLGLLTPHALLAREVMLPIVYLVVSLKELSIVLARCYESIK